MRINSSGAPITHCGGTLPNPQIPVFLRGIAPLCPELLEREANCAQIAAAARVERLRIGCG